MNYLELDEETDTHRLYKYRNKIVKRKRTNATGDFESYIQLLSNDTKRRIKNIYGGNGDITNISASFLLKFPNAKFSDISQNSALKGQILSVFKSQDSTGVLTTYELDTDAPNESELSIYINISWEFSNSSADTSADALIIVVKNSGMLTGIFDAFSYPFNIVELNSSLEAIKVNGHVTSTIHSLVTVYNSGTDEIDIEVKTIGLYDHIGVKINSEDDNSYRRLRTNGIKTINITGVNPDDDVIIATLFNKDYKKLYTFIQSPIMYVQQTQGENGDLFNENVNGSITLNLNANDFVANNQADFITTMNTQTGGFTVVINVFSGSAIIVYKIIFDATKTQQQIDNVLITLNSNTAIQTLINTSVTMNGVTSTKTVGTTAVQENKLTSIAAVIGVRYDGINAKIIFDTIGSYKNILYKATGQGSFLTTTSKIVDLPVGFINQIDIKLVKINDNDITTLETFTVDTIIPVITLIGDNPQNILIGNSYIEVGANVTDNSGDTLTAVITGSVDVNTNGTYIISYNAVDSSGNSAIQVQRTVNINLGLYQSFPGYIGFDKNLATYQNLLDNTEGVGYTGPHLFQNLYCIGSSYKFSISYKFNMGNFYNENAYMHSIMFSNNSSHAIGFFHGGGTSNIRVSYYYNNEQLRYDDTNRWFSDAFRFNTDLYLLETYDKATNQYTLQVNTSIVFTDDVFYYSSTDSGNIVGIDGGDGSITKAIIGNRDGISQPMKGDITDIKISHNILTWADAWPDPIPPVITLNGYDNVYIHLGETYTEPNATATDILDGSVIVTITGTVDVNIVGNYVLSYNAKDTDGNDAIQLQRTVHVINNTYLSNYIAPSNVLVTTNLIKTGINSFTFATPSAVSWGPNSSIVASIGLNIANPWAVMFRFKGTGQDMFLQFNYFSPSIGGQSGGASNNMRFTSNAFYGFNSSNVIINNTTHFPSIKTDGCIIKISYETSPNTIRLIMFKNDGTIAVEATDSVSAQNTLPFHIYNETTNLVGGTVTNIVLVQDDTFGYTEYTTAGY
jgi:hypothetical protein